VAIAPVDAGIERLRFALAGRLLHGSIVAMLGRVAAVTTIGLFTLALGGCSGVSIEVEPRAQVLPEAVDTVFVSHEKVSDPRDEDFLRRLLEKLNERSLIRDLNLAFELREPKPGEPGPEGQAEASDSKVAWLVETCAFLPKSNASAARKVPVGELEDESGGPRPLDEKSAVRPLSLLAPADAFAFIVRGSVVGRDKEPLAEIAMRGDASFDEAFGEDDVQLWFEQTLDRIADEVLNQLRGSSDRAVR
jgi:hypothetical protein